MKQTIFLLISFMALLFACVNSDHTKTSTVEISAIDDTPIDSTQLVTADEVITFWNKFSKALLQNDTLTLSDLIVDDIWINDVYRRDGISKITTMAFPNDTIISKSRFIKEFKKSLNPVYLRLLKRYNVQENIEIKNYHCGESVNNYKYFVETCYEDKYCPSGVFIMSYYIKDEPIENSFVRSVALIFNKVDGKRKLGAILYAFEGINE